MQWPNAARTARPHLGGESASGLRAAQDICGAPSTNGCLKRDAGPRDSDTAAKGHKRPHCENIAKGSREFFAGHIREQMCSSGKGRATTCRREGWAPRGWKRAGDKTLTQERHGDTSSPRAYELPVKGGVLEEVAPVRVSFMVP